VIRLSSTAVCIGWNGGIPQFAAFATAREPAWTGSINKTECGKKVVPDLSQYLANKDKRS
jgi:hypothetical protein